MKLKIHFSALQPNSSDQQAPDIAAPAPLAQTHLNMGMTTRTQHVEGG
jgi:hypothetical protein